MQEIYSSNKVNFKFIGQKLGLPYWCEVNGAKPPSDGLKSNASKSESRQEGGDALAPRRHR